VERGGSPSGSLGSLRELNRLRVVDALRSAGRLSRSDIARRTGLSRSTVSTLVADLVHRGFVVERADGDTPAVQGRPPTMLTLDRSAGAAVGVDFDHDKVRVAVSDLSRSVLAEAVQTADVDHDAGQSIDLAAALIDRVVAEAGVDSARVLGVGVAIAGPVGSATDGVLHPASILPGWDGVDLAHQLGARLGLPVHVDNDANLGALAEVTLGAGRNARHAAYLQISGGIGAGLIVDGRPFRGAFGAAGEIGHVVVDDDGAICRCGNRGCLETVASGPAVTRLIAASRGHEPTVTEMIALAQEGDLGCRRAIADAGRHVGRAVGALCNLFNPEMVVVGGDLSAAGELLLGPLRESVMRSAVPMATGGLDVVAGVLGERANVLGALALAIAQSEQAVAARIAAA
jgi:predicted NBD/HSP70 family sugar kinase